jgi:hypothetical protein
MAKVVVGMTISLDGFVNDRHGSVERLYPDLAALATCSVTGFASSRTSAKAQPRLETINVLESPGRAEIRLRVVK